MSPLDTFPEELLESILAHVVLSNVKPSLHWQGPLLVSKTFHRISKPLYFHTIHLRSQAQLRKLLVSALQPNPDLASHIRQIIIDSVWREAGVLFDLCSRHANLKVLDMTLDGPPFLRPRAIQTRLNVSLHVQYEELDSAEDFCRHLDKLTSVTHLRVRKSGDVYLTQIKARSLVLNLAKAVIAWKDLEVVDLAFRLSDDSGSPHALLPFALPHPLHSPIASGSSTLRPPTAKAGPVTQLTHALSTLPNLHTFATHLPNVWNENILRVSQNPALERIVLVDYSRSCFSGPFFRGPISTPGSTTNASNYSAKDFYPGPVSACISDSTSDSGSLPYARGFGHAYNDLTGLYAPGNGYGTAYSFGMQGTGHFFSQAKNHPRLCELIRAGVGFGFASASSSIRSRARTIGTTTSSSSSSSKSSGSSSQSTISPATPVTDTDTDTDAQHPHLNHASSPRSGQGALSSSTGVVTPIQVSTSSSQREDMRLSASVP